jgi:SAM-dependent methyltransferase
MLEPLKNRIKQLLPRPVLEAWWRARRAVEQLQFHRLDRRETFRRIYARNLWGGDRGEFCSGLGSTEGHAEAYAAMVRAFVAEHGVRSVVDLGCGDFRVAARFITPELDYTGVDIVPELIAHHQQNHATAHVRFMCADILVETLPAADLCLVRQVFQHLSNTEIQQALQRLGQFRHVIVTEHVPDPSRLRAPNRDKPHGPDTRLPEGSGVFIDRAPFAVAGAAVLLDVPADATDPVGGGRIRSQAFIPKR